MDNSKYMSAKEVCIALNIKPQTLYAYVSRGTIRSESASDRRRTRRYHREDVNGIKQKKASRARPGIVAEQALRGMPMRRDRSPWESACPESNSSWKQWARLMGLGCLTIFKQCGFRPFWPIRI